MTVILAIDIGKKNLGWSLYNSSTKSIEFDLYDIQSQITSKDIKAHGQTYCRLLVLTNWLKHMIHKNHVTRLVVEKQVISNVVAKQLEASILTTAMLFKIECSTYDPKNKFKYLNPEFNSKKKEHKRIAESYAKNILIHYGIDLKKFDSYDKQDDISDAICMAWMTWMEDRDDEVRDVLRGKLNSMN
jgi:Holliday junction resolvasome RuvABC endonuclease subunit